MQTDFASLIHFFYYFLPGLEPLNFILFMHTIVLVSVYLYIKMKYKVRFDEVESAATFFCIWVF